MIKYIDEIKKEDLDGKKVLLRVDFDVSLKDGRIADDFRIKAHKETLSFLLDAGAKVLLVSHISATAPVKSQGDHGASSFLPISEELGEILGQTVTLVPHSELGSLGTLFNVSNLLLLDNIRQDPREEKNDEGFARELAGWPALSERSESKGFDFYINDAFAVCHRQHASVSAITKYLPSYGGFLVKKEIENLSKALSAPVEGKVLVLGGAKISTKLPVIKNFLDKAEKILIGGALANNFFKTRGIKVGSSVVDDSVSASWRTNCTTSQVVQLPEDILISGDKTGEEEPEISAIKDLEPGQAILDIGPETAKSFSEIIKNSSMVVWNGPMGLAEIEKFAKGTERVAEAIAGASHSVIGGGDTIAFVSKLDLLAQFSYVSTGGGAMLEFLAGNQLPGLKALGYYDRTYA